MDQVGVFLHLGGQAVARASSEIGMLTGFHPDPSTLLRDLRVVGGEV